MLYREIMAICSQIHTKHINTQCGQNVEFYLNLNYRVYTKEWRGNLVVTPTEHQLWRLHSRTGRCSPLRRQPPSLLATPFAGSNTMRFLSLGVRYRQCLRTTIAHVPQRTEWSDNACTADNYSGHAAPSLGWIWLPCGCVSCDPGCTHWRIVINPLNPELNPICYLLALLGVHHFLHVSRIRVKLLTLRLLMTYIYIYIYGAPILDVSRSHTTTQHSR